MLMIVRLTGVAYGIAIVGSGIVAAIGVPVFTCCIWAYARLGHERRARGRVLASIGLITTVLWSVGLVILFCYIDRHLD